MVVVWTQKIKLTFFFKVILTMLVDHYVSIYLTLTKLGFIKRITLNVLILTHFQ